MSRFWGKVDKTEGCWLWTACLNRDGYGDFNLGRRGQGHELAHRYSWALANGPIPDDLCVLHRCDVRSCVRPDHLFLGTRTDNHADMVAKGRTRGNPTRGEAHNQAKLTAEQVIAIREAGGRQRDVAALFGVSQTLVSRIRRREIWTHI